MWISRYEYEYLEQQVSEYRHKADLLDAVIRAIQNAKYDQSHPGAMVSEDIFVVSKNAFDRVLSELSHANGEVLSPTAERDWYKNAYAELKCKIGDGYEILDK